MAHSSYSLVTAAKNEREYIAKTLDSVAGQTIPPVRWVIVDDGSTDGTDRIVRDYCAAHPFIELVRLPAPQGRSFISKVNAFSHGYARLKVARFDFIGNLDADVSFDADYYARVLEEFLRNRRLGIAGGFVFERYKGEFKSRPSNSERSVAGAVQLFRRECFEAIGGLLPNAAGGEDWIAEVAARMKGWEVRSFTGMRVFHHKTTKILGRGGLRSSFRGGVMDYSVGTHPLFMAVKCLRRLKERPLVIGAFLRALGFCIASSRREKRVVSDEFISYLRREQMARFRFSP